MTRRRSRMIESARTIQVPATTTRARALEKRYLRLAARHALRLWQEVPRVRACLGDLDFAGGLYELLQPHLNGGERQSLERALERGRRVVAMDPHRICGDEDFLFSDDDEEWREVSPATGVRLVLDKLQMRNFYLWLERKMPSLLPRLDQLLAVPALRRLLNEVRCRSRHQAGLLGRMLAQPENRIRRKPAAGSGLVRARESFDCRSCAAGAAAQ